MGILFGNICLPEKGGVLRTYIRYRVILNLGANISESLVGVGFNLNLGTKIGVDRNMNLCTNIEDTIGVFCNGGIFYCSE